MRTLLVFNRITYWILTLRPLKMNRLSLSLCIRRLLQVLNLIQCLVEQKQWFLAFRKYQLFRLRIIWLEMAFMKRLPNILLPMAMRLKTTSLQWAKTCK